MYSVVITFSFSSIVHSAFVFWLWLKMYRQHPPMIDYIYPEALPTAPAFSGNLK